jgi:hypothetical protein
VQQWNEEAAAKVFVFERSDGSRVIADGHQRLALAQRLSRRGQDVRLEGYLFREADGWTPGEVRARAAKKNLQEGSGSVLDTATILREQPNILDRSVAVSSEHFRQAQALARLSPEAFGLVRAGVIEPYIAAPIGEQASGAPMLHRGLAEALIRQDIATAAQARIVVAQALRAGAKLAETRAQMSLFGDEFFAQTLIAEQAKVIEAATRKLGQDARLFGLLRDKGEKIEAKGNVLAGDANASTARLAKIAGELVERLARLDGPVSDVVAQAARAVADKKLTVAKAADDVAEKVIELFETQGLNALLHREPRLPAPESKPIEPATPEAVERAQVREALSASAPPRPEMAGVPVLTLDAARLPALRAQLTASYAAAVKSPPARPDLVEIGPVTPEGASALNALLPPEHDVAGYVHVADAYAARHVFKQHGSEATELPRGQLPVTAEDWARIPDILAAPDRIEFRGERNRGAGIGYWKRFNGTTLYIEQIRTGRGQLAALTMRKLKGDATIENAPRGHDGPEAPGLDAQDGRGASNIAQASLWDQLPADGEAQKLTTRDLLDAEARREGELGKLIEVCNSGAGRNG